MGGTAAFSDKNVGTGKTVTATGLSLSGADAGNYTVNTTASTTADISQRALTVRATADNKVYDGTTAATAHLTDDRVSGDIFTDSYGSAAFSDPNAGTGKTVTVSRISILGADAANYRLVNTTATTTANVTQAATTTGLAVSAATPLFGVDSVTFTATVAATPGGFTGTVDFYDNTTHSDLTPTPLPLINGTATLSTASLAVGSHSITATYSGDGNFLSSSGSTALTVIPPASLSGIVFEDFNDDGQVDFGEKGIAGVTITLTGTDDLGHAVSLSQTHRRRRRLRLPQPAAGQLHPHRDAAGRLPAGHRQRRHGRRHRLRPPTSSSSARPGGQRPELQLRRAAGRHRPVQNGQTAGIGFWNNKNGQALIKALNGGSTSTQLGDWLAATLPTCSAPTPAATTWPARPTPTSRRCSSSDSW